MFENKASEKGTVTLADEVVATIAGIAAVGIAGVAGMSGGVINGIVEFLGKKNLAKGIRVEADNEEVVINLQIIAEYGISIPQACEKFQDSVKHDIEVMTGLAVKTVNIHIQGIRISKEEPQETAIKPSA